MKKTILGIIVGGIVFLIGAVLHDEYKIRTVGNILAYSGIVIASLFTIGFVYFLFRNKYGEKLVTYINQKARAKKKLDAQNELLKYRELYDKEILTKEEFEKKVSELKKSIL